MVILEVIIMAIDFKRYCIKNTVHHKLSIPDNPGEVPDIYKGTMERVLKDLSCRVKTLDHTSVPYIQDTLDYIDDMEKALAPTNGDIPESIIQEVTHSLYHRDFHDVSIDEQSIILIVSMYICVAKNSKMD